jgi:hypothetical protein
MDRAVSTWTAFLGEKRIAAGAPAEVAAIVKPVIDGHGQASVLIFDDETGRQVDFDHRAALPGPDSASGDIPVAGEVRGPGRPRLGVVAREVTLLPRHWEWLNRQSGGASVALRRLVDAARAANTGGDRVKRAREAADRFMSAMAGNLPGYEEASRALYGGAAAAFRQLTDAWPVDIRDHVRRLASAGLDPADSQSH